VCCTLNTVKNANEIRAGKKIRLWLVGTRADTHSFEGLYQNNPDRYKITLWHRDYITGAKAQKRTFFTLLGKDRSDTII
jgi:hypothetical protein